MSFNPVRHPGVAVTNGQGNNRDTKVSGLRVMNSNPLTEAQRAQLDHVFHLHMYNAATALGGYMVRNTQLPDGSKVRIVSNSGMHTIMVWPVGGTVNLQEEPWFIFCIPADYAADPYIAPFGWRAPGDEEEVPEGENGIPSEFFSLASGAQFRLELDKNTAPDLDELEGKRLNRYKELFLPEHTNKSPFTSPGPDSENSTSAQNWEHREWVAPDMRTLVTTYEGKIKVNGKEFDYPPGFSDTLWACIYFYEPSEGEGAKPYLFAVSILNAIVTFSRRPLNDATWETISTFDLGTLHSDATIGMGWNGLPDARRWVFKVQANQSRTFCTLWVQEPSTHEPSWVGCVDIDMADGTAVATPATTETRVITSTPYASAPNGTTTATVEWSGDRQIAFTYDGDTKVFTVLRFSGVETQTATGTSVHGSWSEDVTLTDTRKVELVYDDEVLDTLWQRQIHDFAWNLTADATVHTDLGETEYAAPREGVVSSDVTATTFTMRYFGGPGKTLAYAKKVARVSTVSTYAENSSFQATLSTDTTLLAAQDGMHIVVDDEVLPVLGERTFAGPSLSNTSGLVSVVPWFADATNTPAGAPIVQSYYGAADIGLTGGTSVGHAFYDNYDSADRSWVNTRRVHPPVGSDAKDFVILSVPNPLTTGTPHEPFTTADPESWTQFCSDTEILDKINVPPTTGLMKGIRLK